MQRILYHFPLSPFARKVRVLLKEKDLDFELRVENYWERRREFLAMNPASQVPVLVESNGNLYADSTAICEYLEETYDAKPLMRFSAKDSKSAAHERAEIRRLSSWFNNKFYYEVTKYIVDEKVLKFFRKLGSPSSDSIRAAKNNIAYHLDYMAHLLNKRKWLAGDKFSLADITAAAHLSVLDYLGDVPWEYNQDVKDWYAIIKSRPSFQGLLDDHMPSFRPPHHYRDLDF